MIKFLVNRSIRLLIILIGVSLFAFLLSNLTGDPTLLLISPNATQDEIEEFRAHMGLDQPVWVQYQRFIINIIKGEFPRSLSYNQDPFSLLLERLPATAQLVGLSMAFAILLSFPLGLFLAWKRERWYSTALMSLTIIGYSIPIYWLAIMLVMVFSIFLKWLPPSGFGSTKHLILPVLALGTQQSVILTRMIWGSAIEVFNSEYVQTARSKGISEYAVMLNHVLPNCLIPTITMIGLNMAALLGNAIMTEVIFAWPGVARLSVGAVYSRDYPLIQACVMFMALIFVLTNLTVDIMYTIIDPRVRYN